MKQRVWKVNVDSMDWGRLLKCVGSEEVIGRRRRGIPRKCSTDDFNYDPNTS